MDAGKAIREVIEEMPNFFGLTRNVTIGTGGETEVQVYTQEEIASHVASALIDKLSAKGCLVVELLRVEWTNTAAGQPDCRSPAKRRHTATYGSMNVTAGSTSWTSLHGCLLTMAPQAPLRCWPLTLLPAHTRVSGNDPTSS
ncbi:hypothetical protein [Mycobacteroides salmoniphilum]|uniref:hypothetical protein n=1 Tax=Mycobacteroides salmoniphilum TaxID=404941 RepID=UPI0010EBDCC7|nr:hypothetical protein [Mycobacteroides salmoniphilum]TDZ97959.1 hypothetical protein CCUG62472_00988 [Mycobacteroides salmoniphilum]